MPVESPHLADLAARAEVAEREAWADQLAAASATATLAPRLRLQRLGGDALAFSVPSVPLTLFNRVIGLGLSAAPRAVALDGLPSFFEHAPAGRWAVQPSPGARESALEAQLAARGYQALPQRIAKMARDLLAAPQADPPTPVGLRVERVDAAAAPRFVEPIVAGMGLPPWFRDWLASLPGRPGWHCRAVVRDREPVAAAAMFVVGDLAWLGMATTLPAHRGLGAQRLLMLQRLADATRMGCATACTETGAPQPGEAHPSYSNMLACGMQRVATRSSWAMPARPAS